MLTLVGLTTGFTPTYIYTTGVGLTKKQKKHLNSLMELLFYVYLQFLAISINRSLLESVENAKISFHVHYKSVLKGISKLGSENWEKAFSCKCLKMYFFHLFCYESIKGIKKLLSLLTVIN